MRIPFFPNLFKKAAPSSGSQILSQIVSTGSPIYGRRDYAFLTREGFEKNPTVFKSIMLVAQSCSGIPWKLYQKGSKTREIDDHPLLTLLKKPNPMHGTGSFFEELVTYWILTGNAYVFAVLPSVRAQPTELWTLRPDRMSILPSRMGGVENYEYTVDGKISLFDPNTILHIKMFAANDDWYGFSPLLVAGNLVEQQNSGFDWNTALIQNAGRPSGALIAQGVLGEDQYERLRNMIRDRYTGKRNAGMPMLLEGGIDWKPFSMSPYELDWLESRKSNARDIALVLGVPPELIGDSANKTYSNYGEARLSFYQETVLPLMDRLRDYLNSWIIPFFDQEGKLYLDYDKGDIEALQEDRNGVSQRVIQEWGAGVMTLNEARLALGFTEINGGDVLQFTSQGKLYVPIDGLPKTVEALLDATVNPPAPEKGGEEGEQQGQAEDNGQQPEEQNTEEAGKEEEQGEEEPSKISPKQKKSSPVANRYLNMNKSLQKLYLNRLSKAFARERNMLLRSAQKAAIPETAIYRVEAALSSSLPELKKELLVLSEIISYKAGAFVANELVDGTYQEPFTDPDTLLSSWYPEKKDLLIERIEHLVSWYGDRQLKKIQDCFQTCEDCQIEDCIDKAYKDAAILGYIATSEASYLMNMATASIGILYRETYQATMEKTWMTQHDGKVRESHRMAEGQMKDIDQPFEVDGQLLSYPGDNSLNATLENTINCRCFVVIQKSNAKRITPPKRTLSSPPFRKKNHRRDCYREFIRTSLE